MPNTLTIFDRTSASLRGAPERTLTLVCPQPHLTVRELLRLRVWQEVEAYNQKQGETFIGLVQPGEAERALNGYKMLRPRLIDAQAQYELAQRAFEQNGFIVLIGERQAESLDQTIELEQTSEVTFIKLVPLVGG
jgi:hypothetical protein